MQSEPIFKSDAAVELLAMAVLRQHCLGLTLTDVHRVLKHAGLVANQMTTLQASPTFDAYERSALALFAEEGKAPLAKSLLQTALTPLQPCLHESGAPTPTPAKRFRATPEMQQIAAKKLAEIKDAGIEIKGWARKNGFSVHGTIMVLHGYSNCTRGEVHRIAVALGMKEGMLASLDSFYPRPAAVPRAARPRKAAAA